MDIRRPSNKLTLISPVECDGTREGGQLELQQKNKPQGMARCPSSTNVIVMLPLDSVSGNGFTYASEPWFTQALHLLAQSGAYGVAVDVWWGAVEREPRKYNWSGYKELFEVIKQTGLKAQVVLGFHACGSNVGDNTQIPLPDWVLQCGEHDPDLFFTDQARGGGLGQRNREYLSIWADNAQGLLMGRSPMQCYEDFMVNFRAAFQQELGTLIEEVLIGSGPCGELRYPSYVEARGWRFPGIGEFQCYDRRALASLAQAAREAGHQDWGYGGPHNAGNYCSNPEDTEFFSQQGSWDTEYGRFFLNWYSGSLLRHGEQLVAIATRVFTQRTNHKQRHHHHRQHIQSQQQPSQQHTHTLEGQAQQSSQHLPNLHGQQGPGVCELPPTQEQAHTHSHAGAYSSPCGRAVHWQPLAAGAMGVQGPGDMLNGNSKMHGHGDAHDAGSGLGSLEVAGQAAGGVLCEAPAQGDQPCAEGVQGAGVPGLQVVAAAAAAAPHKASEAKEGYMRSRTSLSNQTDASPHHQRGLYGREVGGVCRGWGRQLSSGQMGDNSAPYTVPHSPHGHLGSPHYLLGRPVSMTLVASSGSMHSSSQHAHSSHNSASNLCAQPLLLGSSRSVEDPLQCPQHGNIASPPRKSLSGDRNSLSGYSVSALNPHTSCDAGASEGTNNQGVTVSGQGVEHVHAPRSTWVHNGIVGIGGGFHASSCSHYRSHAQLQSATGPAWMSCPADPSCIKGGGAGGGGPRSMGGGSSSHNLLFSSLGGCSSLGNISNSSAGGSLQDIQSSCAEGITPLQEEEPLPLSKSNLLQAGASESLATLSTEEEMEGEASRRPDLHLALKIAGIHWWYQSRSHAAELTAGYYNTVLNDGYAPIVNLCAQYGVGLTLTCVEMCDGQHPLPAMCGPEGLLKQLRCLTARAQVPLSGENALPIFLPDNSVDNVALERIVLNARAWGGSYAPSHLSLTPHHRLAHHAHCQSSSQEEAAEDRTGSGSACHFMANASSCVPSYLQAGHSHQQHHTDTHSQQQHMYGHEGKGSPVGPTPRHAQKHPQGHPLFHAAASWGNCSDSVPSAYGSASSGGVGVIGSAPGSFMHTIEGKWQGNEAALSTGGNSNLGSKTSSTEVLSRLGSGSFANSHGSNAKATTSGGSGGCTASWNSMDAQTRSSIDGLARCVAATGLKPYSYSDLTEPLPSLHSFTFLRLGPELLQPSHQMPWLRFMLRMQHEQEVGQI